MRVQTEVGGGKTTKGVWKKCRQAQHTFVGDATTDIERRWSPVKEEPSSYWSAGAGAANWNCGVRENIYGQWRDGRYGRCNG